MMNALNYQDGSQQDLFSSQTSYKSFFSEQIDLTLQLTEFVWVQCDNPECQKWRRVPADTSAKLEENPWYCGMNPDSKLANCQVAEEDYSQFDRIARKVGVKYIMSQLEVGALVWAKMHGYCRWPGILTRDPDTGVHVHLDLDGDPHSYHVEFLGTPHTHSWVRAGAVEVFGHKKEQEVGSERQKPGSVGGKKGGRRRGKKPAKDISKGGKGRTTYRNRHVEDVIQEADRLLRLTATDRLRYSQFVYRQPEDTHIADNTSRNACETCGNYKTRRKQQSSCSHCVQKSRGAHCQQKHHALLAGAKKGASRKKEQKEMSGNKRQSRLSGTPGVCRSSWKNMIGRMPQQLHKSGSLDMTDDSMSRSTLQTELINLRQHDSPDQFSQSQLKFYNSMVDKTKEEKFSIDIDMYRKNEKAFEHDVRRFMWRNGQKIRKTPVWHHVPIKLFQLYLAVHERGGFQKVTERKLWTAIYKELTEQQFVTTGSVAKHYYERNLYPFELYMNGKDYNAAISVPTHRGKHKTNYIENVAIANVVIKQEVPDVLDEDDNSYTKDLEALLKHLDEELDDCDGPDRAGNTELPAVQDKAGKEIKFHDESTETSDNIYRQSMAEFVPGSTGGESNVHHLQGIELSQEDIDLVDVEDKILHEMRALEDQMKDIDAELDIL